MSALDNPHKVVLITSSVPEEGKTSVSMNLAFALAQVKRTCLIDADMRRPSIYKVMEARSILPACRPGREHEPVSKCVYEHESGCLHPVRADSAQSFGMLSSKRFADVIRKLETMFDVILIDSPPVQLVSDAVILAGVANAMVFVVAPTRRPTRYPRARSNC